ncbi:hypothetical protein NLG97_g4259 [Lecanicillium saksenae]|uniref:Uncharacterized protein n=1 Tax=Lecanicillium saksenae TaxID=468837 RepID=A0ACC1QXN2_9HYPO|nr:hypothetical protein NLG97_g4259 [Lecanicillium saksenae]
MLRWRVVGVRLEEEDEDEDEDEDEEEDREEEYQKHQRQGNCETDGVGGWWFWADENCAWTSVPVREEEEEEERAMVACMNRRRESAALAIGPINVHEQWAVCQLA